MTLELAATLLAFIYIGLAIAEKQSSWIFAILSSLLYIFLFWQADLYYQSILQIFFILVSYYGWRAWDSSNAKKAEIGYLSLKQNINSLQVSTMISIAGWWLLKNYSNSPAPFLDSITTFFSITATFLTARKKIESWIYWLIIDLLSIWMFFCQNLYMTAVVYAGFAALSILGLKAWAEKVKRRSEI